jgi:hypothetical protein
VPEGEYELIVWKANWRIERIERDPEWLFQASLDYAAAIEKKQAIRITAGKSVEIRTTFEAVDFELKTR